jgi:hypothetical protein
MQGRDGPWLAVGEEVRLLPMIGGRLMQGRVLTVSVDPPDGAAPSARVRALPRVSAAMHGGRVWVICDVPEHAAVTVFQARLLLTARPGEVELAALTLLADEPRRAALRAAARHPVLLLQPGKVSTGTTSLDLSSIGCRVTIPDGQELLRGQVLQIAVDLDTGSSVWADGEVVWVDGDARVAALRFVRMDPADQERLDRGVLAALTPRAGQLPGAGGSDLPS